MEIALSIPRLPDAQAIRRFARRAEELGFEAVLSGDHIVLPTAGTNQYPYTADGSFSRPADEPFLETMTTLGFMAACTTLGVPYDQRGPMSGEFPEIFKVLWTQNDPEYHGRFYQIDGIQFTPKPVQKPHIPIWIGEHTRRALRRTAKYGDCWHTTRQTPDFVAQNLPYLREQTEKLGRDPASISISLKRSLHFTDMGMGEGHTVRTGGLVMGTTQEVIDDVYYCCELGIDQLTYDFRVEGINACLEAMEHLADRVLPVAQRLG
jgi:alkanesulfonate monooxygenase SsuD/methylene tetrahydromethanopterin reductase-like flavin-dependent oxidoreductase (luciferase family)